MVPSYGHHRRSLGVAALRPAAELEFAIDEAQRIRNSILNASQFVAVPPRTPHHRTVSKDGSAPLGQHKHEEFNVLQAQL